jgi:tRNA (guanine-N7-)-methyltransferase
VRKPRRLSTEELAPYVWEMPFSRPQGLRARSREKEITLGGAVADSVPLQAESVQTPDPSPPTPRVVPVPLDWAVIFGNPNPVEVEVGMGKGLFLLTQALARPEANFFGIEVVRKYQLYAATRCAIRRLPNVKTTCADATMLLRDCITAGSVSAVHILFPDPWWKKRHKKRRVFTPEFAADVARAIRPGGRLHIASDVEEYFGVMGGIIRGMPAFRELIAETSRGSLDVAGYQTNFERKARLKGTPVWRASYERTGEPVTIALDPVASDVPRL